MKAAIVPKSVEDLEQLSEVVSFINSVFGDQAFSQVKSVGGLAGLTVSFEASTMSVRLAMLSRAAVPTTIQAPFEPSSHLASAKELMEWAGIHRDAQVASFFVRLVFGEPAWSQVQLNAWTEVEEAPEDDS
jgi:hypothetical protein